MSSPAPSPLPDQDSTFGTRVRSALAWRYGGQIAAQIITWGSTILVVRLLDPTDYGLFAMSQVVITALMFMDGWGFAQGLVQKKEVSRRDIGQAFALLLLLNTALAALQFLLAPLAAAYYQEPLVADMLRVQALLFITTPFIALPSALLSRELSFRPQAIANMIASVVGAATALLMAWTGYGVWALVIAPLAAFAVRAAGLVVAVKSLPRPVFNLTGARTILAYGGAMTTVQLLWIVQSQSDILIAGRVLPTYDLGLYAEALFLTLIVTARFLPPLNEVAFPAYSELHQRARPLAPYFLRASGAVALITFPMFIGLALTATEAVGTLFGEKWLPMAPIVAGLSLVMPARAMEIICAPATNAIGQPRIAVYTGGVGAMVFVASFLVGVRFGTDGLIAAWWIAAPLLLAYTLGMTLPRIGVGFIDWIRAVAPAGLACGTMTLAVLALDPLMTGRPMWGSLLAKAGAGAGVYLATVMLVAPDMARRSLDLIRRRQPFASEPPGRMDTTQD